MENKHQKGALKQHGSIRSHGYITTNSWTLYFVSIVHRLCTINSNWKNALEKKKGFSKHELSECHKEAVARLITIPKIAAGDSQHALERKKTGMYC